MSFVRKHPVVICSVSFCFTYIAFEVALLSVTVQIGAA